MGAEYSRAVEELASELAKYQNNRQQPCELSRHGWDPKDKSVNINLYDTCTEAVRNDTTGSVDACRGVMTYAGGVHIIQFKWIPGQGKYFALGVATTKAPLTATAPAELLGSTDQSVGWNLVTKKVYFSGCEIGVFPEDVDSSFQVPHNLTMILDCDEGRLMFQLGDTIGVAMKGLKHIGQKMFVVAAMDTPGDSVKIQYVGRQDVLARQLEYENSGELFFHDVCGPKAFLGNQNKTAARKDPRENPCHATVLTSRPLREEESFSVRIDKVVEPKQYASSLTIGVTNIAPLEMEFARDMSKNKQGKTWLWSGNKIYYQRTNVLELDGNCDIDELEDADVVGIKYEKQTLTFYINGSEKGKLQMEDSDKIHGFVDIFGKTRQVSIVDASASFNTQRSIENETMKRPRTEEDYRRCILKMLSMFKTKDPANINKVRDFMLEYIINPFQNITRDIFRCRMADFLAEQKGSAEICTGYIKFVFGNASDELNCYIVVVECMCLFTLKSMKFCTTLGRAGLVQYILISLKDIDRTNLSSSKIRVKLIKSWLRFLQNCARINENQHFYAELDYIALAKQLLTDNEDDVHIVVPVLSTICFLVEDDDPPIISNSMASHMKMALCNAVRTKHSDGSHHYKGWSAHETAMCIGMLVQKDENMRRLTTDGEIFEVLVEMLAFDEGREQECAANALWSLARVENYGRIKKIPNFISNMKKLIIGKNEGAMLAAKRLTIKLSTTGGETRATTTAKATNTSCKYFEICAKFLRTLDVKDAYLDSRFNKCYCIDCHSKRSDKAYYKRGAPPNTHAIPVGWVRFGLSVPARALAMNVHHDWHTAYHGTKRESLQTILDVGTLVPAGRVVIGAVDVREGSKHFNDDYKPDGFDTKQVFLSPSIRYAGVNTYARPCSFAVMDSAGKHATYQARTALQAFIKPGSYKIGRETIGATQAVDPAFENQELEWSTTQEGAIILNALLVKLDKVK